MKAGLLIGFRFVASCAIAIIVSSFAHSALAGERQEQDAFTPFNPGEFYRSFYANDRESFYGNERDWFEQDHGEFFRWNDGDRGRDEHRQKHDRYAKRIDYNPPVPDAPISKPPIPGTPAAVDDSGSSLLLLSLGAGLFCIRRRSAALA